MGASVFSNYSWFELWRPFYLVILVIAGYLYIKHMIRSPIFKVNRNQIQYFFIAITLFYLMKGTPYHVIAKDYLFSAHTFQLAILCFAVIPLLILSFPVEFLRSVFWNYRMKFTLRIFSHPWLNAFLFNSLLSIYFIPPIFNFLKSHIWLLVIAQIIITALAFFMWWIIIAPIPEINMLSNVKKIIYIFFASALLLPIGFFLLIVQVEHYPIYGMVAGEFFKPLNAIYDQQLAGGLLKFTQLISYVYALLFIVLGWGRTEEEKEGEVDEDTRIIRGVVIPYKKKE